MHDLEDNFYLKMQIVKASILIEQQDVQLAAFREALERCADVTERWEHDLARQVNEIARTALGEKE